MAKVLLLLLSFFVFSQASDNQRAQSKLLAEEAAEVEATPTVECSGEGCKDSVVADILVVPLVGFGLFSRIVISASFAVTVLCLFIALVRATGLQSGVWVKLA